MAINFDTVAQTSGAGLTVTLSTFNFTGSNGFVVVDVINQGDASATDVTGVTVNGVSATLGPSGSNSTSDAIYCFYLANPSDGDIVVTRSDTTGTMFIKATSYSGVKQTGQPDASAYLESVTNSLVSSVTTVADNCWTHLGVYNPEGATITASTNTTSRGNSPAYTMSADNNTAITPAGSYSMTVTRDSGSSQFISTMISIAPFATVSSTNNALSMCNF